MMLQLATAVLIDRQQYERVISVPFPPPSEWFLPVPVAFNASVARDLSTPHLPPRSRVFELSLTRRDGRAAHKWMLVYNEGRSQTPENAFVYFERGER